MKIRLRYFASLREKLGMPEEAASLPDHVTTVGAVRAWLRERGGTWAEALAEGRAVRMAVDQQMAGPDAVLSEGCEVAFFPPVTGG